MDSRSPRALIDTPPVWLAVCIALAWAQARLLPVWPAGAGLRWLGLAAIVLGAVLFVAATVEFRRHRTSIIPRETPRALLTSGPYAFSRNPIYLADTLILAGLILRWDLAALPLAAVFMALIQRRFIAGEEAGCAATFGPAWAAYAGRVRRWL
jgi:protein-S-isoprenylcysteine O-methyltransferase Ste14